MLLKHKKKLLFAVLSLIIGTATYFGYPYLKKSPTPTITENLLPKALNGSLAISQHDGISLYSYPQKDPDLFDIGFKKWVLVLENFRPSPSLVCEMKRLQSSRESVNEGFSSLNPLEDFHTAAEKWDKIPLGKNTDWTNHPIIVVSERGFLPGEKITIRARNQDTDHNDTISFYPNPLVLRDIFGKELVCAELTSKNPTLYTLHIPFDAANRLVRLQLIIDNEKADQFMFQNEPLSLICTLINPKKMGGFAQVQFTYEDNNSYELTLPWGSEFIPYAKGERKSN